MQKFSFKMEELCMLLSTRKYVNRPGSFLRQAADASSARDSLLGWDCCAVERVSTLSPPAENLRLHDAGRGVAPGRDLFLSKATGEAITVSVY